MINFFLGLTCLLFSQVINFTESYAFSNKNIEQFLINREKIWPQWNLTKLNSSNITKDLIYPSWFEGNWIVESEDLVNSSNDIISYKVNFEKNKSGEIVGNRSQNSESIGKAIFGDRLKKIKSDPKSFNNQVIYLKDDEYIESRVKARNQIIDDNIFFSDEFVIQTTHKDGLSRINQVEVMSKFFKCNLNQDNKPNDYDICGLQYTATYGSRVGEINVKAIDTNKYKLTFKFIEI
tara:strand:- start:650 stop:1354 length:705 start_codon:yes stop_codon:yes gene_type:complete